MSYQAFSEQKEREAQDGTEYQGFAGGQLITGLFDVPLDKRTAYLPEGELQQTNQGDLGDCASRSPNNNLAPQFTYAHDFKLIKPENRQWLEDTGYVKNGKIDFSDAFIAILSGTTRAGNSLKAPLDAIHNYGLIPKWMLPKEDWMSWDDYYNPKRITPEMKALGAEFARRFEITYYQVPADTFPEVLKMHQLCVGAFAWPAPVDGIYPRTDNSFNHAIAVFAPQFFAFDNYPDAVDGDWIKQLAPDYRFFDWGYYLVVKADITPEERKIQLTVFEILAQYGLTSFFAEWWDRFTTQMRGFFSKP